MPNFKQHVAVSCATSAVTYFGMCRYYDREMDLGELLLCMGVGVVAGAAPDLLEPAIHPNHRAFGHSVTAAGVLGKIATLHCCQYNKVTEEFDKVLVAVMIACYLAHLVADGCTPRGLPLVGY